MTETATAVPTVTLNNGSTIPQLGFGVFQVPPEDTSDVVAKALEVGYRHIDTAALYDNEEGVGAAVRASGLTRDEVFVTTKLGNPHQGAETGLAAFETSLDKLGMDYVDLYLIHWPLPARDLYVETWQMMEKLYAEGRARAIGVSNFQPQHLRRLQAEATVLPAVNQVELHPTLAQTELREVHAQMGIATEAWAPIAKGAELDNPTIGEIAQRVGKSPAQVILRWHLQLGNIVFPKSVTPSRIEENFDLFDFELDDADMTSITALDSGNRTGPHPEQMN
ncbi:MAG: 2,5-didehydrogluconate reductase, partial [Nocardioidaceae bacterium]|jgi:diketogulonate reductase-like aldo/keto reductase|nr:2,5-didehydrogluconate reductase [Nocardioidaceae bacterium]